MAGLSTTFLTITATVTAIDVEDGTSPDALPRTLLTVSTTAQESMTITVPGTNGPPLAIGGVPVFQVGDTWAMQLASAPVGWVPVGLGAGLTPLSVAPPPYNLNGLTYPTESLPLPIWLNENGSDELSLKVTEAIVQAALEDWNSVGCSTFQFEYQGLTEATYADDKLNVLSWEEKTWEWGGTVAGFTATRFGLDSEGNVAPAGADIVFNAVDWAWSEGPGDAYAATPTLNAASVILHELGHVTGMDHEYGLPSSTMFFAYIGGDWQGSLSGDDRRGLCENYPSGSDDCATDADCAGIDAQEYVCVDIEGVQVCDEVRDEIGAFCSRTDFNCAEFCVFTNNSATAGYCSESCTSDSDCPDGTICDDARRFLYDDPDVEEQFCVEGEREDSTDSADPGNTPDTDSGDGEDSKTERGCQMVPASHPGTGWLGLLTLMLMCRARRPLSTEETP